MYLVNESVDYLCEKSGNWNEGYYISKVYETENDTFYQIRKGEPWEELVTVEEYRLRRSNHANARD